MAVKVLVCADEMMRNVAYSVREVARAIGKDRSDDDDAIRKAVRALFSAAGAIEDAASDLEDEHLDNREGES